MDVIWEETPCLLCGSADCELLIEQPNRACVLPCRIVSCRQCGLAYTNPRPTRASIGYFYPADYSPHQDRCRGMRPGGRSPFAALLTGLPRGKLLDFGCGAGDLLRLLHQRGWDVTGLDASSCVVRTIRERFGLHALAGTLPHPDLSPGSFDAITMAESLEHVHDPLGALRAARCLLKPGGRIVVSVPNLAGLPFRWFGTSWIGLDTPRHLTHFTPGTLGHALQVAGFRVERMRPLRHNSWLRHSARQGGAVRQRCGWLRYRLPASLAGWYCAMRGRANGILAVGVA
jgi:SAM-dependent methyltransferase